VVSTPSSLPNAAFWTERLPSLLCLMVIAEMGLEYRATVGIAAAGLCGSRYLISSSCTFYVVYEKASLPSSQCAYPLVSCCVSPYS
jgi:hypothetical protein